MRELKVVDYSYGKKSSDDVITSLPFTENLKECKSIQQANVVISAYVNENIKDTKKVEEKLKEKQDLLIDNGEKQNIKTINGESILGDGDLKIVNDSVVWGNIIGNIENQEDLKNILDEKQDVLKSGENIKTINNISLLGNGNIKIENVLWGNITGDITEQTDLNDLLKEKLPIIEIKDGENNIGYGIIKPLYIGANGNIIETSGQSQFYKNPTVMALEPINANELANKGYIDNKINNKSEVVLYNNSDGENGNVLLNESADNFKYLEIYYMKTEYPSNIYGSTRIYLPNGKRVPLHFGYPASETVTQIITKIITITDNTIIAGKETFLNFAQGSNTVGGVGTSTDCKIYRVVGYR